MTPLLGILVGWLLLISAGVGYALWRSVLHVQQAKDGVVAMLAHVARPLNAPTGAEFTYIKETPPLQGKAALDFYRGFYQTSYWPLLAHKFQADTRQLLLQANALHREGKGDAAHFLSGQAFYASQQAVLVEREIATWTKRMQELEENAQLDKALGLAEDVPRPARY